MSKSVENLSNLTDLSLNFDFCPKITDVGLCCIVLSLKILSSVSRLKLALNCQEISDGGIIYLSIQLNNLTSLKIVDIDFSKCQKITENSKAILTNTLLRIQMFTFCDFVFNYNIISQFTIKIFIQRILLKLLIFLRVKKDFNLKTLENILYKFI